MEEIRKTKWMKHGCFGVKEYRIWKRYSEGFWSVRHEYKMEKGNVERTEWRATFPGWIE